MTYDDFDEERAPQEHRTLEAVRQDFWMASEPKEPKRVSACEGCAKYRDGLCAYKGLGEPARIPARYRGRHCRPLAKGRNQAEDFGFVIYQADGWRTTFGKQGGGR